MHDENGVGVTCHLLAPLRRGDEAHPALAQRLVSLTMSQGLDRGSDRPLRFPVQEKEYIQTSVPEQLGGTPPIAESGRTRASSHASLPGDSMVHRWLYTIRCEVLVSPGSVLLVVCRHLHVHLYVFLQEEVVRWRQRQRVAAAAPS